jgi:hypothetical protein
MKEFRIVAFDVWNSAATYELKDGSEVRSSGEENENGVVLFVDGIAKEFEPDFVFSCWDF